mmetsp:Transcript_81107/g.194589  ORF Transcript_81107/g.194589 Transcript_81107/m.194589 type:complete len:272 (-) Transcript_81107:1213-2028(-)
MLRRMIDALLDILNGRAQPGKINNLTTGRLPKGDLPRVGVHPVEHGVALAVLAPALEPRAILKGLMLLLGLILGQLQVVFQLFHILFQDELHFMQILRLLCRKMAGHLRCSELAQNPRDALCLFESSRSTAVWTHVGRALHGGKAGRCNCRLSEAFAVPSEDVQVDAGAVGHRQSCFGLQGRGHVHDNHDPSQVQRAGEEGQVPGQPGRDRLIARPHAHSPIVVSDDCQVHCQSQDHGRQKDGGIHHPPLRLNDKQVQLVEDAAGKSGRGR